MKLESNTPEEWKAVGGAIAKKLAARLPGIGEALAAWEAYKRGRQEEALEEFLGLLNDRLERVEAHFNPEWLQTDEGRLFAGKVLDAALDMQMADKRQFFANALVNGARAAEMSAFEKAKFVDLLRSLSRVALEVLAELHTIFGPTFKKPRHERSESTYIDRKGQLAAEIGSRMKIDLHLINSALSELDSAGLFSPFLSWRTDSQGRVVTEGGWLDGGVGYSDFTERFVRFIKDPE